jgi:hypothetical protein
MAGLDRVSIQLKPQTDPVHPRAQRGVQLPQNRGTGIRIGLKAVVINAHEERPHADKARWTIEARFRTGIRVIDPHLVATIGLCVRGCAVGAFHKALPVQIEGFKNEAGAAFRMRAMRVLFRHRKAEVDDIAR